MTAPWDRRDVAEQQRVRELTLGRWLAAASSYSPYWDERLRTGGLDPVRLATGDELRLLTPVRESDIYLVGGPGAPGLLMRPTEDQVKAHTDGSMLIDIAKSIRRSGIDGKRLALLQEFKPIHLHRGGRDDDLAIGFSRSDIDRMHRVGARTAALLGLSDTDYLVSAVPAAANLEFWGLYHLALGTSMLALHPRSHSDDVDIVAAAFELVPTTAVAVPVHEAIELADALAAAGASLARVRTVVVVGPPPLPAERVAITEAFRLAGAPDEVRVLAAWAPTEGRALWAECPEGVDKAGNSTGLHTFPDLEVLELLDATTGRRTEGHGDLTYTSMGWHGSALVRYQTGDYVETISHAACPGCGRTVPRLTGAIVPGAWQPAIDTAEGIFRADLRGGAIALGADPGISGWRIEINGPRGKRKFDQVLIEFAGTDTVGEDLGERVAAAMGLTEVTIQRLPDDAVMQEHLKQAGSHFRDAR